MRRRIAAWIAFGLAAGSAKFAQSPAHQRSRHTARVLSAHSRAADVGRPRVHPCEAALTDISSVSFRAISPSVADKYFWEICGRRFILKCRSRLSTCPTITGLGLVPTVPLSRECESSSIEQESFQCAVRVPTPAGCARACTGISSRVEFIPHRNPGTRSRIGHGR